jgi:hypothetical protein
MSGYPRLMQRWFDAAGKLGLPRGPSFDRASHTIPFHGDAALVGKHYLSKRSRRQKGLPAFLAQDAATRVFCYANAARRKGQQSAEVLQFVALWQRRTGPLPGELSFDSKLTTYANLGRLSRRGVPFSTLRRRSAPLLAAVAREPVSAGRRSALDGVSRQVRLNAYEGPLRPWSITGLGHEEPTLVLTNQLARSAAKLIERYARRLLIANNSAAGIEFFHLGALSSAVAMKVNGDVQLTLKASSLSRLLAGQSGHGYETAKARPLFRDFINATALVTIADKEIEVRFQKRAPNPLLIAAGLEKTDTAIPWLGKKRLPLVFG